MKFQNNVKYVEGKPNVQEKCIFYSWIPIIIFKSYILYLVEN